MNAAEKARLAREQQEKQEREAREKAAEERRKARERFNEIIGNILRIGLDVLCFLSLGLMILPLYESILGSTPDPIFWWLYIPLIISFVGIFIRSKIMGEEILDNGLWVSELMLLGLGAVFLLPVMIF